MQWNSQQEDRAQFAEINILDSFNDRGEREVQMVLKDGFKLLIDLDEKHPHEELTYVFPGAKRSRRGKC